MKMGSEIHLRRKAANTLITMLIAACMAACSSQGNSTNVADENEDTAINSVKDVDNKDSEIDENDTTTTVEDIVEGLVLVYPGAEYEYVINNEGERIAQYNKEEIIKTLESEGVDNASEAELRAYYDGILYYSVYEVEGEGGRYSVYALDTSSNEVLQVWKSKKDSFLKAVDCYNGNIYISFTTYEDEREDYHEYVYVKDDNDFKYTKEENDIEKLLNASKGYSLETMSFSYNYSTEQKCYTRSHDENGFVIGLDYTQKRRCVRITADGKTHRLKKIKNNVSEILGYDKNYVIYTVSDKNDYTQYSVYCYDIKNDSVKKVVEDGKYNSYLGYYDDAFYYSSDKSEEYGHKKNCLYRYVPSTDTTSELYMEEAVPGTEIDPVNSGFTIYNGSIYVISVKGDEIKWMNVVIEDGHASLKDIDCTVSTVNSLKYGNVQYKSDIIKCKKCKTLLGKNYEEVFELNPEYSGEYEKINNTLKKIMNDNIKSFKKNASESTGVSCEEHKEMPSQYCEECTNNVKDVNIIKEHYLTVLMNGYTYSGGAHGYPLRAMYTFDLTTGERLGIEDVFKGSEEDFKKIIAEKTVEDYKSYESENNGMNPYYPDDYNNIYETVYKNAGFDTTNLEFREDGVEVVYYPYDMGSYASGFITFVIPYEDMGIEL